MKIPLKTRSKPPYDPVIPLLGIHSKKTKIENDACILFFNGAQFTIARTWKQPRCPSADKWIKLWYIYTMEYSVQFSHSVMSDYLRPHESQHARPPCPSPTPGVHSRVTSIESVMPSCHLILGHPLLLQPPIPLSISLFQ